MILKLKVKLKKITYFQGNIKSKTIVSEGLEEGDVIVTNGFINLFDDANVSVK